MNLKLIQKIEKVFKNTLRGRIGIREASALDSRYDEEGPHYNKKLYNEMKAKDIEVDWKQIPDDVLGADPAVFNYFDIEGFKFVLPAILCWSLKNNYKDKWDVTGALVIYLLNHLPEKLNLTKEQVAVVVEFIEGFLVEREAYLDSKQEKILEHWKAV